MLPFNNSGAIHGKVPLIPPETRVFRLILDSPKSLTYKYLWIHITNQKIKNEKLTMVVIVLITLQTGRCGSRILTSKLSQFRSKWTMFLECKYSIPKAASMVIMSFLRQSSDLK